MLTGFNTLGVVGAFLFLPHTLATVFLLGVIVGLVHGLLRSPCRT